MDYAVKYGYISRALVDYSGTNGKCMDDVWQDKIGYGPQGQNGGSLNIDLLNDPDRVATFKKHIAKRTCAFTVSASGQKFQNYKSGVIRRADCGDDNAGMDHAVHAIGWGVENGIEYALVKNSWGTWWGDNGFYKVELTNEGHGACAMWYLICPGEPEEF